MTFLKTLYSTATGFLGGIQTYLIVGALCLGIGFGGAVYWKDLEAKAAVTAQAVATVKRVELQDKITLNMSLDFSALKFADATATNNLIQEIPEHVTPKDDAACPIPLGFVRVYDAAAHGPVPDASAGADDAPSGVALSDVAKADTLNDGEYDIVAGQLKDLQAWVTQEQNLSTGGK